MDSDCIVCKMRQALDICDFVGAEEEKRQEVLQSVMEILVRRDEIKPEEEVGNMITDEINRILDLDDPYKEVKKVSVRKSLEIYPRLKDIVRTSDNPLKTAVEICITGNVIDFGPSNTYDIERSVGEVLVSKKNHFDWDTFYDELKKNQKQFCC